MRLAGRDGRAAGTYLGLQICVYRIADIYYVGLQVRI